MADEYTPLMPDSPSSPANARQNPNSSPKTRYAPENNSNTGISNTDYLARFRQAIGINAQLPPSTPSYALYDLESTRRSACGLYREIIAAQRQRSRQYQLVDTVYYVALLSNVVIGAVLASLGPLSALHPAAITILGIINSSTSGLLALLKGQGLPDRLRKDGFEMRRVQDFVEQTEIGMACGALPRLTDDGFAALVRDVFERYDVARDTAEMNRPGSYAHQVDSAAASRRGSADSGANGDGAGADLMAPNKRPEDGLGDVESAGLTHAKGEPGAHRGRQSRLALGGGKGHGLAIS